MFPNLYYKIQYQLSNDIKVDFVMIDTIVLCGNTRDIKYNTDPYLVSATPEHPPRGPEDIEAAEDQWQWLDTQLVTST